MVMTVLKQGVKATGIRNPFSLPAEIVDGAEPKNNLYTPAKQGGMSAPPVM